MSNQFINVNPYSIYIVTSIGSESLLDTVSSASLNFAAASLEGYSRDRPNYDHGKMCQLDKS